MHLAIGAWRLKTIAGFEVQSTHHARCGRPDLPRLPHAEQKMTQLTLDTTNLPIDVQREVKEIIDGINRSRLLDGYVQNKSVKGISIGFGDLKPIEKAVPVG